MVTGYWEWGGLRIKNREWYLIKNLIIVLFVINFALDFSINRDDFSSIYLVFFRVFYKIGTWIILQFNNSTGERLD